VVREPANEQDKGRLSHRISRVSRVNRVRACNSVGAVGAVTEGEDEGEKEVEMNERDPILVSAMLTHSCSLPIDSSQPTMTKSGTAGERTEDNHMKKLSMLSRQF
jgi:hypothetical protein